MRIGGSLVLIALGAILRWGITYDASGINLDTIGMILIVVGVIGFIASVLMATMRRRTDVIHESRAPYGGTEARRTTYVEPGPRDPDVY